YIDGYKPLSNYQELLKDVVEKRLIGAPALDKEIAVLIVSPPRPPGPFDDILSIRVPVPVPDRETRTSVCESPTMPVRRAKRNCALGLAGEQLVVRYEQERLSRAGHDRLAGKIVHTSAVESDSRGFDILSYETDGRERLIEVKTTRFGALTPFFASRNEVDVS